MVARITSHQNESCTVEPEIAPVASPAVRHELLQNDTLATRAKPNNSIRNDPLTSLVSDNFAGVCVSLLSGTDSNPATRPVSSRPVDSWAKLIRVDTVRNLIAPTIRETK